MEKFSVPRKTSKRADSPIRKSRSQSQSTRKAGKIVILKIRYEDFSTLTKRKSLDQKTQDASQISQIALQLYEELDEKEKGVRLLGITVTGF